GADSASMADDRSEPPDEVLVVAAIIGDLQAFDQLVLRYRAAVARVVTGIVGREDAEDVAQDTWLLAFKALPSIEDPRKFAAWVAAIARHRAMRFGKHENRLKAQRVALDDVLIEKLEGLSRPLTDKIEDQELREALDSLRPDYSLALKLRYLDEMPVKHITAFLGTPLTTVKWRLRQGKKLLREKLEDRTLTIKGQKGS
ncbi:MAG TPA: sigma-70 family RNA polymerase sigma factor, partial [Pyrinomonadaceae bacterium]|nr:sigma-70 family RNA polymerase sigma factor [Pyrinomonadaceae bacterium]